MNGLPVCIICQNVARAKLLPCHHTGICEECADNLCNSFKPCPVCRDVISNYVIGNWSNRNSGPPPQQDNPPSLNERMTILSDDRLCIITMIRLVDLRAQNETQTPTSYCFSLLEVGQKCLEALSLNQANLYFEKVISSCKSSKVLGRNSPFSLSAELGFLKINFYSMNYDVLDLGLIKSKIIRFEEYLGPNNVTTLDCKHLFLELLDEIGNNEINDYFFDIHHNYDYGLKIGKECLDGRENLLGREDCDTLKTVEFMKRCVLGYAKVLQELGVFPELREKVLNDLQELE